MSGSRKIVATSAVGAPKTLSEKHTIVTSFHDFESLPHRKGDFTRSPEMTCHGHTWKIQLYPGGETSTADEDQTWTSAYLCFASDGNVRANFAFRIGSMVKHCPQPRDFHGSATNSGAWGWPDFLTRSEILDPAKGYLKDGTLEVEVDIQIYVDGPQEAVWSPRSRLSHDLLASLESGDEGDSCITVVDKQFSVIKCLVARRAPTLGDMIASQSGTDASFVIDDVDPILFGGLLRFIYTDELPKDMDYRNLLEVADRFGCSHLKLAAEAQLVKAGVNEENAAELLLFADGHFCALLREAAFEYCAAHPLAIKKSDGWNLLKESPLCAELVGACPTQFSESDIDSMRVATLRRKLEDKGLEVDGTRETLIRRLKENGRLKENE